MARAMLLWSLITMTDTGYNQFAIHSLFFIRDVVILELVLSLKFFQFLTSFVPYLSLIFSKLKPVCSLILAPNSESHMHTQYIQLFIRDD